MIEALVLVCLVLFLLSMSLAACSWSYIRLRGRLGGADLSDHDKQHVFLNKNSDVYHTSTECRHVSAKVVKYRII